MPVLTKINTNSIAEDAITGDKFAGDAYLANTANQNISGTYSENRLYTSDAYTLSGNATVNSHLTLSSVKPTADVVLTASGAYTLTGTGVLSAGSLLAKEGTDLTGMTGVLSSVVTGSPNLNLTTGTIGSGVTFPSQYAFSARLTDNQSVSASTWTKAALNVSIFGGWDTNNYRFRCPRAGKWQFNFSVRFNDGVFGRFVKLYKNGSAWDQGGSVSFGLSSYTPTVRHAVLVELALNDYIELYVEGGSGITRIAHDDDGIIQTGIQGFLLLG